MSDINKTSHTVQEVEANPGLIDETYTLLNGRHNILYQFVMRYDDYIYNTHDYGTGDALTMIESHTLSFIDDHAGTTVTELASFWRKTKGAISQIVSRLEGYGLIEKRKASDNGKTVLLYATETGKKPVQPTRCMISLISQRPWENWGKSAPPMTLIPSSASFPSIMTSSPEILKKTTFRNDKEDEKTKNKHKIRTLHCAL